MASKESLFIFQKRIRPINDNSWDAERQYLVLSTGKDNLVRIIGIWYRILRKALRISTAFLGVGCT